MILLHSLYVTPGRCGLYETANDLIVSENRCGVETFVCDPVKDGDFSEQIEACDAIVDHSGLTSQMMKSDKPIIHMRHGRPRSTFLIEQRGGTKAFSHILKQRERYAAIVTFWPEHVEQLEFLFGRPVHYVPSFANLDRWTPDGPSGYGFGGKKGEINIVCTDVCRDDVDLFDVICDFGANAPEEARLHVYGLIEKVPEAIGRLLGRLGSRMGEAKGWVSGLENVYRAADATLTPHVIATRAVRESMASGCPVIRSWSEFEDRDTMIETRRKAMELFDPMKSVEAFLDVVESVSNKEICHA